MASKEETATAAEIATPKMCFIATPLGLDRSEVRRKADGVIHSVLAPILEEFGYKPIPPHKSNGGECNRLITNKKQNI